MSISPVDRSATAVLNQIFGTSSPSDQSDPDANDTATPQDTVALSPQGLRLSSLFDAEPGQPIDLQAFADKKLTDFSRRFQALLTANGIDTSQPITLGHEAGSGRVIVTNDHPEADQIERLLAQNFDLCNTYTAGTSALEIARHGQEYSRFAQAYARDPQAAVAQFRYLFDTCWKATVTFSQDGFDVHYSRQPRG